MLTRSGSQNSLVRPFLKFDTVHKTLNDQLRKEFLHMKINILIASALFSLVCASSTLASEPVVNCTPYQGHFLRIYKRDNRFVGFYKSYGHNQHVVQMSCKRLTRKPYLFECRKNNLIATVYSQNGKLAVEHSLDGDFGPTDSGYLYTMNCK